MPKHDSDFHNNKVYAAKPGAFLAITELCEIIGLQPIYPTDSDSVFCVAVWQGFARAREPLHRSLQIVDGAYRWKAATDFSEGR
jgi:hypothetical protein